MEEFGWRSGGKKSGLACLVENCVASAGVGSIKKSKAMKPSTVEKTELSRQFSSDDWQSLIGSEEFREALDQSLELAKVVAHKKLVIERAVSRRKRLGGFSWPT